MEIINIKNILSNILFNIFNNNEKLLILEMNLLYILYIINLFFYSNLDNIFNYIIHDNNNNN